MIQRAKKEVLGHFLEFGLLDQLDIAYCDSTKCFLTFGNVTRSLRIIKDYKNAFLNDPKSQKRGFAYLHICLILHDDINTILVKVLKVLVMKVKK